MSDDDSVQQHRNKTMVFTLEERKLLLRLVNMHYDVLNNKKVDSASTQLKNQAWDAIHKEYLAHTTLVRLSRTPQQLKRCWENMKCKAKKGDRVSVSLLRWGEMQYRAQQGDGKWITDSRLNSSTSTLDLMEEESEADFKDVLPENNAAKVEQMQSVNNSFDTNILKLTQAIENGSCAHCNCDKGEKTARIQLITLEKQQNEELHQLKLQMIKERNKREKELHKLAVHELSLKIENERRRAEILEKELGN
ncbi:UNVERIFIED_CONTAM: hypothetical protein PYX00_005091 [Menopon gallinae]|uniref:Regulatory protein zeste n=1 Tax=Menopon gallinae TaxID=328185 RepID=A0AAW2HR49_9NEOP